MTLNELLKYVLDLGSVVLVPIMIFILGLIFREKPSKALRSGVLIGIAFVMINILLGALLTSASPAGKAMVERTGIKLTTVDIGWAAAGAIAFASRYGLLIIPIAFAVNLIMLALRATKTLNIDIWNFWHFAYIGAVVEAVMGSFVWGWTAAIALEVISLIAADLSQRRLSEFAGLPGVSFTTSPTIGHMAYAWVGNKVFDAIPFFKRVKFTPERLQERIGILGEAWLHGIIVGALLGILAGYDVKGILQLAITIAGIVYVFPKVIDTLMAGLIPLSEAAKRFAKERLAGREIFIGIDWITLCKPAHITLGLLFMPITLLLAFILPGNTTLPLADLAFVFAFAWVVLPYVGGDLLRAFILGVIAIAGGLYIASWQAADFTQAAIAAGQEMPEGAMLVTNVFKGCDYPTAAIYGIAKLLSRLF